MKRKLYYVLTLLLVVLATDLSAQTKISGTGTQDSSEEFFKLNREILFNETSRQKDITIDVDASTREFNIEIKSVINAGKLKVEIFDNNGMKQGTFKISKQTQADDYDETASGSFNKLIANPTIGTWIVRISPEEAIGGINIQTYFVK
ncbi:MAG: hypothetical protein WBA74_13745 [Cyclobacteriaceae bacterium]